ncbi:MAG: TIM-barrel domain-containing protein [Lachnospiraceae bacterium]
MTAGLSRPPAVCRTDRGYRFLCDGRKCVVLERGISGGTAILLTELYVRWFQFGAFLPVFRSHGTEFAREPWNSELWGTVLRCAEKDV